jgi:hypothetical protein
MSRRAYVVKRNDYDDDDYEDDDEHKINFMFAEVRINTRPGFVTHTDQSNERFR